MHTTPIVLLVALAACGPTINNYVTTGGDGDATGPVDGSTSDGSSGLSASESTGAIGTSTTGEDDSTTGEGTSTDGSGGSSSSSSSSSTGGPRCAVELFGGAEQCVCDGMPADPADCDCAVLGPPLLFCACAGVEKEPSACACAFDEAGQCSCEGVIYDPLVCGAEPCPVVPINPSVFECQCDGAPSDPLDCGCLVPSPGTCVCEGVYYPADTCEPL